MSTLRIISEEVPPAVLQLETGVIAIGRQDGNHFQIVHPTVSGHHCELNCSEGRVAVKDLNSTNGTFINDQRIQESTLEPGHVLRLGDIRLLYEAPVAKSRVHLSIEHAPQPVAEPIYQAVDSPPIFHPCKKHPQVEGQWICSQCRTVYCETCVEKRITAQKTWRNCALCKAKVVSLEEHNQRQEALAARSRLTFNQRLGSAFSYPFVKGGVFFLLMGTFIFWFVSVAKLIVTAVPIYGYTAMGILVTFSWGWLFAYIQKIIVSCSNDEDVLPEWPEISDYTSDLVHPFLLCLGTLAICFGPALIYSFYSATYELSPFFFYAIFLLGVVYMPMALLVVSLTCSLKSANPFVVLPAITKVPGSYSLVCLFFLAGLGLWNGLQQLVTWTAPVPVAKASILAPTFWKLGWGLPIGFVFLYCLVVCIRALGMMYRCHRAKLGWFKDF